MDGVAFGQLIQIWKIRGFSQVNHLWNGSFEDRNWVNLVLLQSELSRLSQADHRNGNAEMCEYGNCFPTHNGIYVIIFISGFHEIRFPFLLVSSSFYCQAYSMDSGAHRHPSTSTKTSFFGMDFYGSPTRDVEKHAFARFLPSFFLVYRLYKGHSYSLESVDLGYSHSYEF